MTHLLDTELLSVDDVLLVPRRGILDSRSKAEMNSFLYSAPMDTVTGYDLTKALVAAGHTAVICRNIPEAEWMKCAEEFANNPNVFFAIGLDRKQLATRLEQFAEAGATGPISLALDIAHGDMEIAHVLTSWLSALDCVDKIMSGSICTLEAAQRAMNAGCTHLRIGVGPGSMCTTRVQTGVGYPQLSAVYKIHQGLQRDRMSPPTYKDDLTFTTSRDAVQLIADGGVRTPGDAVKYLSAGADGVMLGGVFAKALEARGWAHEGWVPVDTSEPVNFPIPEPEPVYSKNLRGHASASFMRSHGKANACPEGTSTKLIWDGAFTKDIVDLFEGGVRSAISYLGLRSIKQLKPKNTTMIKITGNTVAEGKPHGAQHGKTNS